LGYSCGMAEDCAPGAGCGYCCAAERAAWLPEAGSRE